MEKGNNNKVVIVLLIVIIGILSVLCILFATNTISFKSNDIDNNINENGNDNQSVENDNDGNQNTNNMQQDNAISNDNETKPIQNELGENDTFSTITNSGIVEVIGYPETKERIDGWGKKYSYVYFHIKETKSIEFKKYIESLKGNSFVLDDAIGIGCNIDGKVTYYNSSDELGEKEYEMSQENSSKILNATKDNPIKVKLERLIYSSGKGAPICTSHITKIEVVD